ncbi:MAG: hypothetical protein WC718_10210 [Phycisphaerales bacterium]
MLVALFFVRTPTARAQSFIPLPTGPYIVGRESMILRDASRTDPFSPRANDVRRLAVLIWYPAAPRRGGSPLMPPRPGERADFTASLLGFARISQSQGETRPLSVILQGLRALQPNVFEDLDPRRDGPFPLVIMSHGLGSMPEEYDSLAEDLASRGMIVVGVNHTYASFVSMYLPGRPTYNAPDLNQVRFDLQPQAGSAISDQWVQDLRFVLDQMLRFNSQRSNFWFHRIDSTRVAAMGHSMGGSASTGLAFTDSRVSCAINLDGSLWGQTLAAHPNKPVMFVQSEGSTFEDLPEIPGDDLLAALGVTREQYAAGRAFAIASNAGVVNQSIAGGCWVRIAGAVHTAFTDFALIGAADGGTIDPTRLRTLLRSYISAFLREQLFGTRAGILRAPSPDFPEVTVVRSAP